MVNSTNHIYERLYDVVPDGVIIRDNYEGRRRRNAVVYLPEIDTEFKLQIPLQNLAMNVFLDSNSYEFINEYYKLTYFIVYTVCEDNDFINPKELSEYIMLHYAYLGKVNSYNDISRIANMLTERFSRISFSSAKEIVYRIWIGDYISMINARE